MSEEGNRQDGAFIGVSLDSDRFTREWLSRAFELALERHSRLKLVVADDLLIYTRTASLRNGEAMLDIADVKRRCERRYTDAAVFLRRCIDRLGPASASHVVVRRFGECITTEYVAIHRFLLIAYQTVSGFSESVTRAAVSHGHAGQLAGGRAESLNALFLLDEMAMCIALGEFGSYRYEYSPYDQIAPLQQLYAGEFEAQGLTVQTLTGGEARRRFQTLPSVPG